MQITSALLTSVAVAVTGILIYWANPERQVNRAVAMGSAQTAVWLLLWHITTVVPIDKGLPWLRWTCTVGAFAPFCYYCIKETLLPKKNLTGRQMIIRHGIWLLIPITMAILPQTDWFIPSNSTHVTRLRGPLYWVYSAGQFVTTVATAIVAVRQSKALPRARRIELNVFLVGACTMFATVIVLSTVSELTRNPIFRMLDPICALVLYAITVYAITTHRIVDARQLFLIIIQRCALVLILATVAVFTFTVVRLWANGRVAFIAAVVVGWWLKDPLHRWLNRLFKFYPQSTEAIAATVAAAKETQQLDQLESAFAGVLAGWGQTEKVMLVSGSSEVLRGVGPDIHGTDPVLALMREIRWATPERLSRERNTSSREALRQLLQRESLGVLVFVEGPSITALVGVGLPTSKMPYTFPQVQQLQNIAAVMEPPLERAHFLLRTKRAELLSAVGMLGAGLAHEIRNPLASIRTFLQLLRSKFSDPAFCRRFLPPIREEVTRMEQLTAQLRELGRERQYRFEKIDLSEILRPGSSLLPNTTPLNNVELIIEAGSQSIKAFTDVAAVRQVVLNLLLNAAQAVSATGNPGWVKISAARIDEDHCEIVVSDSGPGIPPGAREQLFKPFHSTKATGFGLGLAVSNDIVEHLHGEIILDPYCAGCGASFHVILPTRQWEKAELLPRLPAQVLRPVLL